MKIAVVYNIIWGILAVLCIWVTCQPVSFAWDRTDPNGSCGHATIMLLIVGGLDVLGDIVIFVIPITVIKHIQVSKTEKRLLYGLFGVGAM